MELNSYLVLIVGLCEQCNEHAVPIKCLLHGYHPNPATPKLPTHVETRTHDQCGDTIEKSQAPDDGCININTRNVLSIEEEK
jgi:hypothetical protein